MNVVVICRISNTGWWCHSNTSSVL